MKRCCCTSHVCCATKYFIKREMSTMKLIRHPNVIRTYEITAIFILVICNRRCVSFCRFVEVRQVKRCIPQRPQVRCQWCS
ncbi:hypothetical protein RDI58_004025 [Solanum bulbocastanum]|uniref:Uncharacterized protein n=1 Tax=Solanum bulbocastanum TaxID=147425 RepID=A0AAN8U0S2_SOLBU